MKKPSERIREISRELKNSDDAPEGFIRTQAILQFLDEEYERNKPYKCEHQWNVSKSLIPPNMACQKCGLMR